MISNSRSGIIRRLMSVWLATCVCILVSACGGGGGGGHTFVASSASSTSSSLVSSSASSAGISLSGTVTYDFVPHNANGIGLNYLGTEARPVRGAPVELLDANGAVLDSTQTDTNGHYSFQVTPQTQVKVRVNAELIRNSAPTWYFKVTDNTSNNALYVLDGMLTTTGSSDSQRDLHAASGWDGLSYSQPRAAAPFAILDDIYIGANRILSAGNMRNLPLLELRWSPRNTDADGDFSIGEIGTSFYNGDAIYILGDADNDTDEYDPHVLLHEWGHYIENVLFRSDSPGGDHSNSKKLDMRLAMSEGFANAFSAMMLNDSDYSDASGVGQSSGFTFDVAQKSRSNRGFYSEGSIGSIFYNFYTNNQGKTANDFSSILQVMGSSAYYKHDAETSIYLFYGQVQAHSAQQGEALQELLAEQDIYGIDEFGAGETNGAGSSLVLPVYKFIVADNMPVNVCSTSAFGKFNKLGDSQFLSLTVNQTGVYTLKVTKNGGDNVISNPEVWLYQQGRSVLHISNTVSDQALGNVTLARGNYVLEVYDLNNHNDQNTDTYTRCFDVRIALN